METVTQPAASQPKSSRKPKVELLDWQGLSAYLGTGREASQAILRIIGVKVGKKIVASPEAVDRWLTHRVPIER
jgi:hypothetical protein